MRILKDTTSICPECGVRLSARYVKEEGAVFMKKNCKTCGEFSELIDYSEELFRRRHRLHYEFPTGNSRPHTLADRGCPHDCGLCSRHSNTPCLVNIDLTDRCNMNCPICFADANAGQPRDFPIEKLGNIIQDLRELHPPPLSIQYAGGEPTLHPYFLEAVKMAKDNGFLDVQVATNGLKFKDKNFARQAKESGLDVLYLQFDSVSDAIYEEIRGRALFEDKKKILRICHEVGLKVVLVPTIVRGLNNGKELGDMLNFAVEKSYVVTGFSFQPVSLTGRIDHQERKEMRYTLSDLILDLEKYVSWIRHDDWFPFGFINPVSRFLEATTGEKKMHFNCHPICGAASYIIINPNNMEAYPLNRFLDIEAAMQEVEEAAETMEKWPWLAKVGYPKLQLHRILNKHFYHQNLELRVKDVKNFIYTLTRGRDPEAETRKDHFYHKLGGKFNALLLAAMHFQDNYNFDLERVGNCVIHYASVDGNLYPFCTWNSGPCHRFQTVSAP